MNGSNLKYGIVSEVKPGFARVEFTEDEIVSDWLPVLVRRSKSNKQSWQLEVNEHVVCMMDEEAEAGVVLGAIPNDEDKPDPGEAAGKCRILFSDGTLFEYNINSGEMTVDVKGQLKAKTTGACSIDAGTQLTGKAGVKATVEAPNIELTGNVKINGVLVVTGAATMAAVSAAGLSIQPGGKMTQEGGGSLKADVNIETTGTITGSDVKAGTVSLKTHTHISGASGSPTSPPQ
jgi:phage baseplate assembly protein V